MDGFLPHHFHTRRCEINRDYVQSTEICPLVYKADHGQQSPFHKRVQLQHLYPAQAATMPKTLPDSLVQNVKRRQGEEQ